ncbi:glycosyltransferase [Caloranaerobacter sp. DY30410]|uniref:glycosyltransferase n=1 Tax=Caloranaerobacter sp. DY30410 TaxID=3238305 RepID=UPI003CFCF2CB
MKKKIAFILPSLGGGGSEKVVINIIKYLNRNKYNIRLIVINLKGPYIKDLPDDIDIVNLGHKRLRYSFVDLAKELIRFNPDYVFSTLGYLNFGIIVIVKLFKLKSHIIIRESSTPSKYIERLPTIRKYLFSYLYKILYNRADIIVAQCDIMKEDLINNFNINATKVKRIYNPIDIENIVIKGSEFNPYDDRYVNVVAVGRLVYAKGYDILLHSIKKLMDIIPNIKLYIVGDGPLRNDLINLAYELGINEITEFIGFVKNPYPYIKNAQLFVLSSRWEGFPNTLLEALACGTKCVATNCMSGPKEILGDNEYGFLAETEDSKSLYLNMLKCLSSENRTKNRAKDFDIKKIIHEYEKIFDN